MSDFDLEKILVSCVPQRLALRLLKFVSAMDRRPAIVGYDFDPLGLHKVKVYIRFDGLRRLDAIQAGSNFCPDRKEVFEDLLRTLGNVLRSDGCPAMLAVGFLPQRNISEVKLYVPVANWGSPTFRVAAGVLRSALGRWNYASDDLLSGDGPIGFEPTLISVGIDSHRELLALYMKPLLLS